METQYQNTYIFFKKYPSTLIRVIRNNKNSPKGRERERERERVLIIFVWEKYGLIGGNDIKFIQNKMRIRRVKL